MEQVSFVLGLTHLSVILCMNPSMQPHIQEQDVPMTCRLNFCIPISFFENTHYKVKCLPGFLCYVIYLVHPVSIALYDYSQVFTTVCFQNFFVTKGVTQWNFNLIAFHLPGFTFALFSTAHSPKVSRSFCNFSLSFLFVIFLYIIQL